MPTAGMMTDDRLTGRIPIDGELECHAIAPVSPMATLTRESRTFKDHECLAQTIRKFAEFGGLRLRTPPSSVNHKERTRFPSVSLAEPERKSRESCSEIAPIVDSTLPFIRLGRALKNGECREGDIAICLTGWPRVVIPGF